MSIDPLKRDLIVNEKILNSVQGSSACGDDEDIIIFQNDDTDESVTDEFSSFDKSILENGQWKTIEANQNRALGFLWETGSKTYQTSSGVSVTLDESENAEIYENTETGEVIVIGANGATISSNSNNAKISIYDSDIENMKTSSGNDDIKVFNSNIQKIDSGKGIDSVTIKNSSVKQIETGSGSDTVTIANSQIGDTNTSSNFLWGAFDSSDDTVIINNSTAENVRTGKGNNKVITNKSTVNTLETGSGNSAVNINDSQVENLNVNNSSVVVNDSNYIDIEADVIKNIPSDSAILLEDGRSITVNDYANYILSQPVGFETEEEYQEYVLQFLSLNYESMKGTFQRQQDSDGIVSNGYDLLKELTDLGISADDIDDILSKQEEMINGLTAALNGESNMTFEEAFEYYTGTEYSKEKIDKYMETSNLYAAVMVGCQYDEDYIDKIEKATGKSINDISKEYALCQLDTFGKSTGFQDLVEKYSADQEGFADKLSSVISAAGMTCILVGAVVSFVFPPAAAVGMSLMTAGRYISLSGMYIDNVIDLVDDSTDKDGLTKEELGNIALETGVETVSYAAGRGIGKLTQGLNSTVNSKLLQAGAGKVTSYIAGQAAETATDTVLSLSADYAIAQGQSLITTGEFMPADEYWSLDRFLGEGKNQLMGILTGLASQKVSAYQEGIIKVAQEKINAGDIDGAKAYMKQSGMKMSDESFDSFVKSVEEVRVQAEIDEALKMQVSDGDELLAEAVRNYDIDEDVKVPDSDTAIKNSEVDTEVKAAEVDTVTKSPDSGTKVSDEVRQERYTALVEAGVQPAYAKDIAKLTPEEYKNYEYLVSENIDSYNAGKIARLNDTQIERAVDLASKGVPDSKIADLAVLEGTPKLRTEELLSMGINPYYIADIATLDEKTYNTVVELITNKGLNAPTAIDVAKLNGADYTNALSEIEAGSYKDFKNEITPDIESKLTAQAEILYGKTQPQIGRAESEISELSGESGAILTARPKGVQSTLKKLIVKYEKGKINLGETSTPESIAADCEKAIGDSYGTRLQLKSLTPEQTRAAVEKGLIGTSLGYDEFIAYMKSGTGEDNVIGFDKIKAGVIETLKTAQTGYVVDRLIRGIRGKSINITELNNYGSRSSSYFTNEQLLEIANAYEETTGKKLTVVTRVDVEEAKEAFGARINSDGTMENDYMIIKNKGAEKNSGYTSTQMNVKHKLDDEGTQTGNGELQIRGTEVNTFGDVEHIPYDIRQGKITAKDVEYSEVYKTIESMDDSSYSNYNRYLSQTYEWLRMKELGIEMPKPELDGVYKTKTGEVISASDMGKLTMEGLTELNRKIHE